MEVVLYSFDLFPPCGRLLVSLSLSWCHCLLCCLDTSPCFHISPRRLSALSLYMTPLCSSHLFSFCKLHPDNLLIFKEHILMTCPFLFSKVHFLCHWHLCSFSPAGFFTSCSVSSYKTGPRYDSGMTLHATCFITVFSELRCFTFQ